MGPVFVLRSTDRKRRPAYTGAECRQANRDGQLNSALSYFIHEPAKRCSDRCIAETASARGLQNVTLDRLRFSSRADWSTIVVRLMQCQQCRKNDNKNERIEYVLNVNKALFETIQRIRYLKFGFSFAQLRHTIIANFCIRHAYVYDFVFFVFVFKAQTSEDFGRMKNYGGVTKVISGSLVLLMLVRAGQRYMITRARRYRHLEI